MTAPSFYKEATTPCLTHSSGRPLLIEWLRVDIRDEPCVLWSSTLSVYEARENVTKTLRKRCENTTKMLAVSTIVDDIKY